jgi:hypothetical protein
MRLRGARHKNYIHTQEFERWNAQKMRILSISSLFLGIYITVAFGNNLEGRFWRYLFWNGSNLPYLMNKYTSMASALYTSIATFVEFSVEKVAIFCSVELFRRGKAYFNMLLLTNRRMCPFTGVLSYILATVVCWTVWFTTVRQHFRKHVLVRQIYKYSKNTCVFRSKVLAFWPE